MKPMKMLGLAAIAAVAAMAFVGASSASATFTQLCVRHDFATGLVCPAGSARTDIHLTLAPGQESRLLSSVATILCLELLIKATALALAGPQQVHVLEKFAGGCGSDANHDNCEFIAEELPLSNLLKTGLDEGTLTATNGQLHLICEDVGGFIDLDCKYNTTGVLYTVGAQHVTADKTKVTEVGDKFICPNTSTLDVLLKTLDPTFVLG